MKVAIFLGSKSDSETMKKAAEVLKDFGVDYKAYILSAHRAGDLLVKTIKTVEEEGCEVIIAGAGLSAALPGNSQSHGSACNWSSVGVHKSG